MKKFLGIAAIAAGVMISSSVMAQTYSVGTNPQGSLFYRIGSALSTVMVDKTGLQFRAAPYGGSSTYVSLMQQGKVDFGIANGSEAAFAFAGEEIFEGKPHKNVRAVAVTVAAPSGWAVRKDSGITTFEQLKGKRIPGVYTSGRIFHYLAGGHLAGADMDWDDFQVVPTNNFVVGINQFIAGKVDAGYIPYNSGIGKKAMASIPGGWRYLSSGCGPEASKKMAAVIPTGRSKALPAKKGGKDGIVDNPTCFMEVDFYVLAGAHVKDDVVYSVVKTMHANKKPLAAAFGIFNRFNPDNMMGETPVPYHKGAIKAYQELGLLKK